MRSILVATAALISTPPALAQNRPQAGPFSLGKVNTGADLDHGRPVAPAGRPSAAPD